MMAFVIQKKPSGLYFAGFAEGKATWGDESQAVTWDNRLHAETQAQLLQHPVSELSRILGEALANA